MLEGKVLLLETKMERHRYFDWREKILSFDWLLLIAQEHFFSLSSIVVLLPSKMPGSKTKNDENGSFFSRSLSLCYGIVSSHVDSNRRHIDFHLNMPSGETSPCRFFPTRSSPSFRLAVTMGCKQTRTKSPAAVVVRTVPADTTAAGAASPAFVKSALKKPPTSGRSRMDKLSARHRPPATLTRSVIFDEKVQVKSRTPTPRESHYESRRSASTTDGNDQEVTSISSEEESQQLVPTSSSVNKSVQRNATNGFRSRSNAVAVFPSAKTLPAEPTPPNSNADLLPMGKRFRVPRKAANNRSSPVPRDSPATQTGYYAFVRTPKENKND